MVGVNPPALAPRRLLHFGMRRATFDCETRMEDSSRIMQNPPFDPAQYLLVNVYQASRHAALNARQRLLQPIERRFHTKSLNDGEAVAVRAYVRTGRRATRRT